MGNRSVTCHSAVSGPKDGRTWSAASSMYSSSISRSAASTSGVLSPADCLPLFMEERRNFFEGRPLSIISKGEGLRLARGAFAPFILEEGSWVFCDVVEGDTESPVLCTAVVEVGAGVEV